MSNGMTHHSRARPALRRVASRTLELAAAPVAHNARRFAGCMREPTVLSPLPRSWLAKPAPRKFALAAALLTAQDSDAGTGPTNVDFPVRDRLHYSVWETKN